MTLDPDIITHDELDPPRIVYVPRRIDTPEQAAALPGGHGPSWHVEAPEYDR